MLVVLVFASIAIGVTMLVLRWAFSAVVPERRLRSFDQGVATVGKLAVLVLLAIAAGIVLIVSFSGG